jgi:hypothetical protein
MDRNGQFAKFKAIFLKLINGLIGLSIFFAPLFILEAYFGKPITLFILAISSIIYILVTTLIVGFSVSTSLLERNLEQDIEKERIDFYFAVFLIQFLFFIILSRSIFLLYGSDYYENLPNSVSISTWIFFAIDNFLDVLTCGFFHIYGFDISNVENAPNFLISSFIFSYNASISIGLIKILLFVIEKMDKTR